MKKAEVIEIIKKRFGTSDEDLKDLEVIMNALEGLERADFLEQELANMKIENEKALKDLDETWRNRYRDRFFAGDVAFEDVIDKLENPAEKEDANEDISIEEYLEELTKEEKK